MPDGEVVESDNHRRVSPPDSFSTLLVDAFSSIPYFAVLVSIILYILSNTTIFNNNVLAKLGKGNVDSNGDKTDYGVVISGIFVGILLGIFIALHNSEII